jgi:hypothetical protein
MVRENRQTLKMAEVDGFGAPSAVQLAGCDPQTMAEAAKLAADRGAAIIDINFGCPVKKVAVGQSAGSALMRDELRAAAILEATVKAVDVPVTLKMRMGWDHNSLNAPKLAKIAEDCGIRLVTVPRSPCAVTETEKEARGAGKTREEKTPRKITENIYMYIGMRMSGHMRSNMQSNADLNLSFHYGAYIYKYISIKLRSANCIWMCINRYIAFDHHQRYS